MTDVRAFLSFDTVHNDPERLEFFEQIKDCPTVFSVPSSSTTDQSPGSDSTSHLRDRIYKCDVMIVLVGKDTATASNVKKEIDLARRSNVPFFGVYVGGAEAPAALPENLSANRVIPLDWSRIGSAMTQLMGEGRHHVFH